MTDNIDPFLNSKRVTKDDNNQDYTHTRIGDSNILGGKFRINDDDISDLFNKHNYIDKVILNKSKQEYLTEKQLIEDGPNLIDIDLKYHDDITDRQHTKDDIIKLLDLYMEHLSEVYNINKNVKIKIFILERECPYEYESKGETYLKDGIHININFSSHKAIQIIIRNKILETIKDVWSKIFEVNINTAEQTYDEGIVKGHTNWQMIGSMKPKRGPYEITYIFDYIYNSDFKEWSYKEKNVKDFNYKKNFKLLLARNNSHCKFDIKDKYKEEYELELSKLTRKKKKTISEEEEKTNELDNTAQTILCNNDYALSEAHEYVMILPKEYYTEFNKWIRVGWALKNISDKLFWTWVKFSRQSPEHDSDEELRERWDSFDGTSGYKLGSIIYWLKNDPESYEKYKKLKETTVSHYVDVSINTQTEYDIAMVLYTLHKDDYVCVSIKHSGWFHYNGNRWKKDDCGVTLKKYISKELANMYLHKKISIDSEMLRHDADSVEYKKLKFLSDSINDLIKKKFKKPGPKSSIMTEAEELFYDETFLEKLDENPYLMGFNNGVVDFKEKIFRKSRPDDYLSMSTKIDYPVDISEKLHIKAEIDSFFRQLFPIESLRKYMWEHIASCMLGTNLNQTFNIYTGTGANGKSKLIDLLSKCFGEYKGVVPLSLITQKRASIGSTSSEIAALKGKRLAVMQETSKGDTMNEGIVKEITGGDPLQGRFLFENMITFIPQFSLICACNSMMDVNSNDDGIWRRLMVCEFLSKFLAEPYNNLDKFPRESYPYQFPIDKEIDRKFTIWAPVLAHMLVNICFVTGGNVTFCKEVTSASDKYREGQDYFAEYIKEKLIKDPNGSLKKAELTEDFKQWYGSCYDKKVPRVTDLCTLIDKQFGAFKTKHKQWKGVRILYDNEIDELNS